MSLVDPERGEIGSYGTTNPAPEGPGGNAGSMIDDVLASTSSLVARAPASSRHLSLNLTEPSKNAATLSLVVSVLPMPALIEMISDWSTGFGRSCAL